MFHFLCTCMMNMGSNVFKVCLHCGSGLCIVFIYLLFLLYPKCSGAYCFRSACRFLCKVPVTLTRYGAHTSI